LNKLEESLTKRNTLQYKNFIEIRMSYLNYMEKHQTTINNYNVSDKKYNDLETNRFGNKLYYKKQENLKDEASKIKKHFKTYSTDYKMNELEKYNLLPKRYMKKKFYAFKKKPILKQSEENKNEIHANFNKKKYSDEEEIFKQRGYLNQEVSENEDDNAPKVKPNLRIDESYLNNFCKELVKKEFNPDINVYGEYQFGNKNKIVMMKNASTDSLIKSRQAKTVDNNLNNIGVAHDEHGLIGDADLLYEKISFKNVLDNFAQMDKRTKDKFFNTFYKYNKSISMTKHPLKDVILHEETDKNVGDCVIQNGKIECKIKPKKRNSILSLYQMALLKAENPNRLLQYHPGLEKTLPDNRYNLVHNPKISYNKWKSIKNFKLIIR